MNSADGPGLDRQGGTERLNGAVERVTFHNPDNGFCVLQVKVRGRWQPVTVVGTAACVAPGEYVECDGWWEQDRSHGTQFKARHLSIVPPRTLEGIEKYLASGMVRGIGPHFARKLVKAFGERVFDVIEHEPERLRELEGIGPTRQQSVTAAWREQKAIRDIMVFLRSHGVGTARAVRIFKTYGNDAIATVRQNPYRLALDIQGTGFATADALARELGIPGDSPLRARAGVRHVLQELSVQGHCAAARHELVAATVKLLGIPAAVVDAAIDAELRANNLAAEPINGQPGVFLMPLQRAEAGAARHLARLLRGRPCWDCVDTDKAIPWVERATGLELSASQRHAVAVAVNGKLTVITGGPGVGKTTVLNSILRIVGAKGARVVLCAPTGRAAKRLAEATGLEARTIHRTLEFDPRRRGFKRGLDHPLEADLVVVDEVSMVDIVLMNRLLQAVPDHGALLMVGDADQLPSVGPGAVLADVMDSGCVPTVQLTEIFRQAATSKIIASAHRINRGVLPERQEPPQALSDFYVIAADSPEAVHSKLLQMVTERIPRRFGFDPVADIQVLTPMNRGMLGTTALNAVLQKTLNPGAEPRLSRFGTIFAPGDKVVQTINNYDKEVFNGDTGCIAGIDTDEGMAVIDFDGRRLSYPVAELDELSLAYAMTVHKSQGSEYPAVVIPLALQHYTLLERKLLYTAVTRGKRLVVIVAQMKALAMAVKNARSDRRLTKLAARLSEAHRLEDSH